jgi:MazG family protein
VLKNWEDIKASEKGSASVYEPDSAQSLLDGIPSKLPALHEAYQLTAKASRVGFDWSRLEEIVAKLHEESGELLKAHREKGGQDIADEVGDLLFVTVNVARFLGIDPETALKRTNKKFFRRFQYVESAIKARGKDLKDATLAEMDALWEEAKEK